MNCPQCGSENVSIEFVQAGSTTKKHGTGLGGNINNMARTATALCTFGASNLIWKKSTGGEKSQAITQKVCLCQACGNSWALDKGKKGLLK